MVCYNVKHILFQTYFSVKQICFTLKQNLFHIFLQFLKDGRIFTIQIFFLGSFQNFPTQNSNKNVNQNLSHYNSGLDQI